MKSITALKVLCTIFARRVLSSNSDMSVPKYAINLLVSSLLFIFQFGLEVKCSPVNFKICSINAQKCSSIESLRLDELSDGNEIPSIFKSYKNLKELDLTQNHLRVIPTKSFAGAKELDDVDLSANEIHDVEDYAFKGANKLKTINLNLNYLKIIRKRTFAGVPSLEWLKLQENRIEVVEEGSFDIASLKIIFFDSNRVTHLSDTIFKQTPHLEIAYFGSNGLTTIGKAFYNLKNLNSVSFRDSHLRDVDIHAFVRSNPKLKNLYLEDSGIQFLDFKPEYKTYQNILRCLYLTGNNLENSKLLEFLQPFKKLEYLDIAFNNFTHIDDLESIRSKLPKIVQIMYPGNPLNCSWTKSTLFDRKLFTVPTYHRAAMNESDYSIVDGIYCKP